MPGKLKGKKLKTEDSALHSVSESAGTILTKGLQNLKKAVSEGFVGDIGLTSLKKAQDRAKKKKEKEALRRK